MEAEVTVKSYKKECSGKILDGLERGLQKVGLLVERQAKQNVSQSTGHPQVQTGRLRASITHIAERESVQIGTNVFYGKYLEFGTSRMPPYPWLFPAVEANRQRIVELLKGSEFTIA